MYGIQEDIFSDFKCELVNKAIFLAIYSLLMFYKTASQKVVSFFPAAASTLEKANLWRI